MMHAILIPFGTAGDVHPFLGVAEAPHRRGYRVTVVSDNAFANVILRSDLGSIALALSAGIPQLAVPMGMDQHANAERLKPLGTSAVMQSKHYQASRVAATIEKLITNEDIRGVWSLCRRQGNKRI
jgi:UDP:flavonoid glycosyltransferase YjiC (YdhE family)